MLVRVYGHQKPSAEDMVANFAAELGRAFEI
jgi:hypothetical protein